MLQHKNIKVFTDNIDYKALEQLYALEKTGIFNNMPVRIMPDVHAGAGCVIGFTAKINDKIIPNLVGVDIGCGMLCVELGEVDIDFKKLDYVIRKYVPSGQNVGKYSSEAHILIQKLKCKKYLKNIDWLECSLGTLGGGNHFIEVDEDENGVKYLVIHSGSRNLGKQVADYYQDLAIKEYRTVSNKEIVEKLKAEGKEKEIASTLAKLKEEKPNLPKDLCYLQGKSMEDYLYDMQICTKFADLNRFFIVNNIIGNLFGIFNFKYFTTRHNYISDDNYIRKGAISAQKGERVLIPLNMRDGCIIGIGKGNADWNFSAPHGAGRIMSRSKAKENIKIEDFQKTMAGIYSTTINNGTIDEAPFAYKPAQEIIDLVKETIEIEKIIKPIYNYKASE